MKTSVKSHAAKTEKADLRDGISFFRQFATGLCLFHRQPHNIWWEERDAKISPTKIVYTDTFCIYKNPLSR